jgi:hypothetical protein
MRPTLEQLSLALADSLDDRPLGMVTNDLTVGLLFGEPTGHKEESLLAFAPPFVPFDLRAMSVFFFDRKK